MAQNSDQKFFEIIHPHSNYEFIGKQRYWIGLSVVLTLLTLIMLPLNAYVLKGRGHMLNWGVDFRGGSEILIEFSKPVEAGDIRKTLAEVGFPDADVVKYADPTGKKLWNYMIRVGAVSVVSEQQAKQIRESLSKEGDASLKRFEWSEGGTRSTSATIAPWIRRCSVTRSRLSASTRPRCRLSAAPTRTPTR